MRFYELAHQILAKFVPMEPVTKNELQAGALQWYNKHRDEIAHIKLQNEKIAKENDDNQDDADYKPQSLLKLNIKHKIFEVLESWWMRYLMAFSFILIVPKLKAIINGEPSGSGDDPDDDDEGDELEEFLKWKRFKKSMV